MRVVVDTNVLITYFWPKSVFKEIIKEQSAELFAPEFALKEIEKHKDVIKKKTRSDEEAFQKNKNALKTEVHFVPVEKYQESLHEADRVSPDPEDIDFLALAMKIRALVWSNDKALAQQEHVPIINTEEIIDLLL